MKTLYIVDDTSYVDQLNNSLPEPVVPDEIDVDTLTLPYTLAVYDLISRP